MVVAVSASGVRWIEALIALLDLHYDGFKDIASRASLELSCLQPYTTHQSVAGLSDTAFPKSLSSRLAISYSKSPITTAMFMVNWCKQP